LFPAITKSSRAGDAKYRSLREVVHRRFTTSVFRPKRSWVHPARAYEEPAGSCDPIGARVLNKLNPRLLLRNPTLAEEVDATLWLNAAGVVIVAFRGGGGSRNAGVTPRSLLPSRRAEEIGIRVALGAGSGCLRLSQRANALCRPGSVLESPITMRPRPLRSVLYEVSSTDPITVVQQ